MPIPDGTDPATLDLETRYRYARARMAELELRQRQQSLIAYEEVQRLLSDRGRDLHRQFAQLGRDLAPTLVDLSEAEIVREIDSAVQTCLREFVRLAADGRCLD